MLNDNEKSGLSQGQNTVKAAGGDRVNEFFQKNRKGILITIGIIGILLIGLIVFLSVRDSMEKKAIAEVERFIEEYEKLRNNINDEQYTDEVNDFLAKLESFAGGKKGFAASRAWAISAGIYSGREDWARAEEAWVNSAHAGEKTYLGPVAYFQAAIAAEEQNKIEIAIEYFKKCTSHSFEFTDAPRAQFNIGRLYEQLGNKALAIEAYRAVLLNYQWENDSFNQANFIWLNFARNRIIVLEM